jgi:hypothetical protein
MIQIIPYCSFDPEDGKSIGIGNIYDWNAMSIKILWEEEFPFDFSKGILYAIGSNVFFCEIYIRS